MKHVKVLLLFSLFIVACTIGYSYLPPTAEKQGITVGFTELPLALPLSTSDPLNETVFSDCYGRVDTRILDNKTTVSYSLYNNHNDIVEAIVEICIGDGVCKTDEVYSSPQYRFIAYVYFDTLPEYEEPTVKIIKEIKHRE